MVGYQEFINRKYDARHNVVNQAVFSFDMKGGSLIEVQEIRSAKFHSSGVAGEQIIAVYLDRYMTDLFDVKVIKNSEIDSTGNIGNTVITRYAGALITGGGGEITYSDAIDRQTISSDSFDARGNAFEQIVKRESFDSNTGVYVFVESQKIKNDEFDVYDQVKHSIVENYDKDAINRVSTLDGFIDLQDTRYDAYD